MAPETKGHLIGVLIVAAIAAVGVFMVTIGFGRFGRSAGDAPNWVLIAAGAAFLLAAGSFGLSAIGGIVYGAKAGPDGSLSGGAPYAIRAAQIVLSLSVVAVLATVATWVAFNPEAASGTGRKAVFAAGAVMVWAMFFGFAIWRLRWLRR